MQWFSGPFEIWTARGGATLAENAGGRFEDRWVRLKIKNPAPTSEAGRGQKSKIKNIWTNGLPEVISLPVAHREGRVVMKDSNVNEALLYVDRGGNPTMEYPYNPNGSERAIAGICDETGRILGLMPHPERFYLPFQYPGPWNGEVPYGMKIIKNAVSWVEETTESTELQPQTCPPFHFGRRGSQRPPREKNKEKQHPL